jgi:hypothetical protein
MLTRHHPPCPHLLPGLLAAIQGMYFSSNFHYLTHPLSHLSHPSGLPETLPVSLIWLLLLDVFFWIFFSPSFLHSFALVSLPLRLLLLPLHTRRAVVCSCVVATGASSSVLNHLFLYLWFCCRPFPRKTTIIIIIELNYFFSLFFVFFCGGGVFFGFS